MILTKTVEVVIAQRTRKHWQDKGYVVPETKNTKLIVKVSDLLPKSNVRVVCRCDECGKFFTNRYSRNTDTCYTCFVKEKMKDNNYGSANKGKTVECMQGEKHPRWNPNKTEFRKYSTRVRWLTEKVYKNNKEILNPHNYPRRLCGVDGGYQLDHIISVKTGFLENRTPEEIACISNLQLLPWKDNRTKF